MVWQGARVAPFYGFLRYLLFLVYSFVLYSTLKSPGRVLAHILIALVAVYTLTYTINSICKRETFYNTNSFSVCSFAAPGLPISIYVDIGIEINVPAAYIYSTMLKIKPNKIVLRKFNLYIYLRILLDV